MGATCCKWMHCLKKSKSSSSKRIFTIVPQRSPAKFKELTSIHQSNETNQVFTSLNHPSFEGFNRPTHINPAVPPLNLDSVLQTVPVPSLFCVTTSQIPSRDRRVADKDMEEIVAEFNVDSESSLLKENPEQLPPVSIRQSTPPSESSQEQSKMFIVIHENLEDSSQSFSRKHESPRIT